MALREITAVGLTTICFVESFLACGNSRAHSWLRLRCSALAAPFALKLVIGETAVVGDGVCVLQGVTLGGTGNQTGDRHPKVGKGCHIGAGSSILGNIPLGEVRKKIRVKRQAACCTMCVYRFHTLMFGAFANLGASSAGMLQ